MTSLLFFGFLLLLFSHLNLRDRVKRLEAQRETSPEAAAAVPAREMRTPAMPIPAASPAGTRMSTAVTPEPSPQFAPVHAARVAPSPTPSRFVTWFKEHTLIKIGGIFFFLGAAWFVSYAIKEGWLSPEIRVLLGFLLALAAYGLSWIRKQRESLMEYHVLTALGTGIMSATVLAAYGVFGLIPGEFALVLLALSVIYTVYVAFPTRTLWLTMCAAILGMASPLMTNTAEDMYTLLPYLLVLTAGLLLVGLRVGWRPLTLLLLVGVLGYEFMHVDTASSTFLFSFVAVFSLVFFVSTTLSLIKTTEPQAIDVSTLALLSVGYIYLSAALRPDATLAIFVATAVVAMTGYALLTRQYPARVVAVYLGLATIGVLIGTSFLFSGYTLVLAYICEVTATFLLVTHLGLPERAVLTSTSLYLLPLIGSLASLTSPAWNSGAWHSDGLVVYAMLAALLTSTLWLIHKPGVAIYRSGQSLAAFFGITTCVYAYAVSMVVAAAVFLPSIAPVMTYILWALISVSVMYYGLKKNLPLSVAKMAAASLVIPVVASIPSFFATEWSLGVYHIHGFGLLLMIVILILATLLLTQQFCRDYDRGLRSIIGVGVTLTTVYIGALFTSVWDNLLPVATATVATYVTYALLVYLLVSLLVSVRAQVTWIKRAILALVIPILMSLSSFTATGWPEGPLSPDAVGLFVLISLAVLLGIGLERKAAYVDEVSGQRVFTPWSKALFAVALAYTVGLIWSVAHSAILPNQAISLSLFVYTVSGLSAYLYGKRYQKQDITYVGIILLTIVVLRLLLIDVWNMEILWRVITLIGIGALFIGASLLERRPR